MRIPTFDSPVCKDFSVLPLTDIPQERAVKGTGGFHLQFVQAFNSSNFALLRFLMMSLRFHDLRVNWNSIFLKVEVQVFFPRWNRVTFESQLACWMFFLIVRSAFVKSFCTLYQMSLPFKGISKLYGIRPRTFIHSVGFNLRTRPISKSWCDGHTRR